jgi:hypothetical protein
MLTLAPLSTGYYKSANISAGYAAVVVYMDTISGVSVSATNSAPPVYPTSISNGTFLLNSALNTQWFFKISSTSSNSINFTFTLNGICKM